MGFRLMHQMDGHLLQQGNEARVGITTMRLQETALIIPIGMVTSMTLAIHSLITNQVVAAGSFLSSQ